MSCQSDGQDELGLLSPDLRRPLEAHVLPHLSLADLGRLACCSRAAHSLLLQASLGLWKAAAATLLPEKHPGLASTNLASLQASLRVYAACLQNLQQGMDSRCLVLASHHLRASFAASTIYKCP